jgi:hypothetical protein
MEIRIIKSSDVAACPITSLSVSHYRDDGSCRCTASTAEAEVAAAKAAFTEACARLRRF